MKNLRKILKPLSILYGEVTSARNKAYDKKIIDSTSFDFPVIAVGNLAVGGTGKTPQIEYLINLLKNDYLIAVLSRGYKRKSKGFQIAQKDSTAETIGDEPMQYYKKFEQIIVAVDANRKHGIETLRELKPQPEIILLDDALQHRKVNPGFKILLTTYDSLYIEDTMLPTGDLREKSVGADRADIIIVSKCKKNLSEEEQFKTAQKLNPKLHQTVFFTSIDYDDSVFSKKNHINIKELKNYDVLLVTGIAKTQPLTNHLRENEIKFEHLEYRDHYDFSKKDLNLIQEKFNHLENKQKIILTTEKDYVRSFDSFEENVYYLPIQTKFLANQKDFDKLIINYVRQDSRNS